ncbi:hypothetical protein PVNG_06204 [Plasmodium vivax North Korean]|uniref:Variable surface protein n=1 Tax=Plasmodium vivax North Korean TaxID=1035514 RepID=A0A0J9TZD8_PLAVI|nr:hypothetical protein PVNG_06204 [Plasmodium vivax North Korean]
MRIIRNYNIKEYIKFIFILKFFTLILLIWICYLMSDKCILGRHLKNEYKVQGMSLEGFNRLLAKHGIQKELRSHTQEKFLSDNIINKNMKNVSGYTSTYGQVNKGRKNDLDLYMRGYERRYSKRNGLGKLDCYFEKKVFHKIEDIDNLIDKMQNSKKSLKKKLFYKYGIRFILFSLIPIFGIIIPLVHNEYFAKYFNCYVGCSNSNHMNNSSHKSDIPQVQIKESTWNAICAVNSVLYYVTLFIVISVFIYIFIKFIKYQRLKACRSKMNIKEYCKFCKDIF